jgi:aliphatic sulfonates family ABC transporter substrate-binding protein
LATEGSALVLVAENQGFLKQNGINVTINHYDTGPIVINELLKGNIDIAYAGEYPFVGSAFRRENIQSIGVVDKCQNEYVVGRKDLGIESISDLKGKTIALPKGTLAEFYLGQFLILHGINMSDITTINMTLAKSIDALANGDVDAVVNWEPHTTRAKESLGSNAVAWSVQNGQNSYYLLICRGDWIKENPELVKQFLKSLVQAEEFTKNNPEEAIKIVKNKVNFTDAYIETVWKLNQFSLSLDNSLVVTMENEARWMINNWLTTETVTPDFLNYVYLEGLTSVKPESVNIIR